MDIVAWVVVGLIAGWLAGQVMEGGDYGLVGDIALGVMGAMLGGYLAGAVFGGNYISGVDVTTVFVAFLGASVLIVILRALPSSSAV